jgi:hypothetical protein
MHVQINKSFKNCFFQGVAMFDRLTINSKSKASWLVIVMFILSHGGHICSGQGQTEVELIPFLESWQKQPVETKTNLVLKTEWVGTVKRAYLRDPQGINKEREPEHIRFSEVFARRDLWRTNEPLRLSIVRVRKSTTGGGHYVMSEAPVFYEKLPTAKQVSEGKNLAELERHFGAQHGVTSGWGDGTRMNWTEGWTCFTVEAKDRLRYLSVFAHVSKAKDAKDADIDIISVSEGEFRPANPNSAEEKAKYKTGEALYAEEIARLKASWEKYPMPLRRLVAAAQKPNDYDLKAYKEELEAFRAKPDPILVKQLVHQLHDDGTTEFSGMLNALFDDKHFLAVKGWDSEARKQAVRLLAETLPEIRSRLVLQNVIFKVLAMQGGGAFKMKGKSAAWEIDLSVELLENGHSTSYSASPDDKQVPRAALECLEELKKRYPELWRR